MTKRVSRKIILDWLNSISLPIERIENVGMGVVLCQILKKLDDKFPKFKINVQNETDYFNNLSIVKKYFHAKQIKFYFPIENMCELKMKSNLEVIQWFYTYWLENTKEQKTYIETKNSIEHGIVSFQYNAQNNNELSICEISNPKNGKQYFLKNSISNEYHIPTQSIQDMSSSTFLGKNADDENETLIARIENMKRALNLLQQERNFYYHKLLSIEKILTKTNSLNKHSMGLIFDIMYKTKNDNYDFKL